MEHPVDDIIESFQWVGPETIIFTGILLLILAGLIRVPNRFIDALAILIFAGSLYACTHAFFEESPLLFSMLRTNALASFVKVLVNAAAIMTCMLSIRNVQDHRSEYYALIASIVLGAHLLAMTTNYLMIFIAVEMISISSYVLAGYSFEKRGAEGSLKYFLFGSAASAVMLYGFSFLYGLTGTIDFGKAAFVENLVNQQGPLATFAAVAVFMGILFKISAAPMHFWAPDVYDAAPTPVVAFFSTVPKLAGLTLFLKFSIAIGLFGQAMVNWKWLFIIAIIVTITVGNFAALKQTVVKRMMAYSSIAQSGFLMIGIIVSSEQGFHFFLFYSAVYVIMNFLAFVYINSFENNGATTIADYAGTSQTSILPHLAMLVAFVALTGLPPTAGFTGKLFIFSSVWSDFEVDHSNAVLALLVFGLLNTVISLFYYLRIPYYAFFKTGRPAISHNILPFENLLGLFLVLLLLILFFQPGLLMSWINKINFVL